MIFVYILLLIGGFVFLIKGADVFVSGSSSLARNFHVPGLIVGLTIVALGTSAPELAVSTTAALQGSNEIALSNVIGSNIMNLLVVLGLCAIVYPLPVEKSALKRDFPFSIIIAIGLLFAACGSFIFGGNFSGYQMEENVGKVTRIISIILLVLFVAYICLLIYSAKKEGTPEDEEEKTPTWKCLLQILIGMVMVIAGGQAVVYGAKELARAAGMTETLIGLTVVAVGTSLPELVTSLVAAKKGETELAIGNVIGSNIFNLLFILGVSSTIRPVAVNLASVCDLVILIGVSIMTYIFACTSRKISRTQGIIMVSVYVADVVFAILR